MCLIAKDLPKKCKKTIVVYKEIKILNYDNVIKLKTPFIDVPIVSPLMIAKPIQSRDGIRSIHINDKVKAGYIHSFQKYCTFIINKVVKAYIPKGAYYIEGKHNDIASTKLILDPRDIYAQTGYKFPISERIKFFLWRIIHLIK